MEQKEKCNGEQKTNLSENDFLIDANPYILNEEFIGEKSKNEEQRSIKFHYETSVPIIILLFATIGYLISYTKPNIQIESITALVSSG